MIFSVRELSEVLSVPLCRIYSAIHQNTLRTIPGTSPMLMQHKDIDKWLKNNDCKCLYDIVLDKGNYYYRVVDCLERNIRYTAPSIDKEARIKQPKFSAHHAA